MIVVSTRVDQETRQQGSGAGAQGASAQARRPGRAGGRGGPAAGASQRLTGRNSLRGVVMENPLILVIDDSLTIRKMVECHLSQAGYNVAMAATAEAGLELGASRSGRT